MAKNKKLKSEVTWTFNQDADITIGEVHVSKLPKILLALLVILLIASAIAAYYFQDVLYDFIVQPEVVLKEDEISIEVGSGPFNAEEYIAKLPADGLEPDRYEVTLPKNSSVDTNVVKDYNVEYKVRVISNDKVGISTLVVHVVDTQAPVIKLTEHNIELIREEDTFKCMDYVESVSDNYDTTVKVQCSDKIDWASNSVVVDYVSDDKYGNTTVEKLEITIKDKPKPSYQCWDGSLAWNAAGCPAKPQANSGGNTSGGGNSYSGGSSSNSGGQSSGGNSSGGGQSSAPAPAPVANTPYINCASCSVAVGDLGALSACLSGTSSNVTIGIDYSGVNLSTPGSYSVSVYAIDGSISKSCGVTVHE